MARLGLGLAVQVDLVGRQAHVCGYVPYKDGVSGLGYLYVLRHRVPQV